VIKPVHDIDTPFETATFGMGCYWAAECVFGAHKGVLRTRAEYSGGTFKNPNHENL
jgi:peptide-methionine (S)-S-oxide reductase